MSKDVPHEGVFRICRTSRLEAPPRLGRHHYQLAWEGRTLRYNQRFGRGPYREQLDLSQVLALKVVNDTRRRSRLGQHIVLTMRAGGAQFVLIRPEEADFGQFLYWLMVSVSTHSARGHVAGMKKAGKALSRPRRKKLKARRAIGEYTVDHDNFINALVRFEERKVELHDDSQALAMFGTRAPKRETVEVSIFSDGQVVTQPQGELQAEGGTIIENTERLGRGAAGLLLSAERLVKEVRGPLGNVTRETEPCVVKTVMTIVPGIVSRLAPYAEETINEGRVLAALGSHDNIIKLIDVRVSRSMVFLVLEKGIMDLAARAEALSGAGQKMEVAQVRKIVTGMMAGLAHMHARRIYHLDFKPENVMLCVDPEGGEMAKLIDFGKSLSKDLWTSRDIFSATDHWERYGTKRYIPPESYGPKPTHGIHLAKRDSYAMGILIFRTLLGPLYDDWSYLEPPPPPAPVDGEVNIHDIYETREEIEARTEFWRTSSHEPDLLQQLDEDGLVDISAMATGLINPRRDDRLTIEEAYAMLTGDQQTLGGGPPAPARPRGGRRSSRRLF